MGIPCAHLGRGASLKQVRRQEEPSHRGYENMRIRSGTTIPKKSKANCTQSYANVRLRTTCLDDETVINYQNTHHKTTTHSTSKGASP